MIQDYDKDGGYLKCPICGLNLDLGKDGQPMTPIDKPVGWYQHGDHGRSKIAGVKQAEGIHIKSKKGWLKP